jgi:hypothetical protein
MALEPFVGLWPLFHNLPLLGRGISPSQGLYAQNKCTQTSVPRVGFEATILAFELAKTVHASDRAATVIDALPMLQS